MDIKDMVLDYTTKHLIKRIEELGYRPIYLPKKVNNFEAYVMWRIILTTDIERYKMNASTYEYGLIIPPTNLGKIAEYIKKFDLGNVGKAFIIKRGRIKFLLD